MYLRIYILLFIASVNILHVAPIFTSCCQAHFLYPSLGSGIYSINGQDGYCDMQNGGWQLVSHFSVPNSTHDLSDATHNYLFRTRPIWIEAPNNSTKFAIPLSPFSVYDVGHWESINWGSVLKSTGKQYGIRQQFFRGQGASQFDVTFRFIFDGILLQNDAIDTSTNPYNTTRLWPLSQRFVITDTTGLSWNTVNTAFFWKPRPALKANSYDACGSYHYGVCCDCTSFFDDVNRYDGGAGIISQGGDTAASWAPHLTANQSIDDIVFHPYGESVWGFAGGAQTLNYWLMDANDGDDCVNNYCNRSGDLQATCVDLKYQYTCNCSTGFSPQNYSTTPSYHISCVNTVASCASPQSDTTINPPTLVPLSYGNTGFLSPNVLTVSWIWPFVQTRANPNITFLTNNGNPANPLTPATGCPVPQYTLSSPVNCLSTLTFNLQWNTANIAACGFFKSSNATPGVIGSTDIYTGYISLTATESVSAGRSTVIRTIENTFQIQISFQRSAQVSISITVAAAVNITSAIISQEFGTKIEGEGTTQFVMQIGYPYMLTLQNSSGPMDSITGINGTAPTTTLTVVSNNPATQNGGYSSSTYLLTIAPSSSMCTLNAIYATLNTRFQIVCTQTAIQNNQCPTLLNSGAGITLSITSSSFCAQVVENVGVTLGMDSYSDSLFQNKNPAFVIQQNGFIYFLVYVQSSPQVSVTSLSISQVSISAPHLQNGQTIVLYDAFNSNPALTSMGDTFQYGLSQFTIPSGGPYAAFCIGEVPNWNVVQDSMDTVKIGAKVTVSYQGFGGQKRAVLSIQQSPASQTQGSTSSTLTIHAAGQSAAAKLTSSIVLLFVIVVVFVLTI